MSRSILIVEDDERLAAVLSRALSREGYQIYIANTAKDGMEKLSREMPGVVLTDIYLPDGTGMEILESAKALAADAEVIVMTAHATVESAIQAMKLGARDYLLKPFQIDELILHMKKIFETRAIQVENALLREEIRNLYDFSGIVGRSQAVRELLPVIENVADSRSSVLIQGESGTGKELIARAIHFNGSRAEKMFIPINCSAIPENLLESELFGHVKGAFTGAAENKRGIFEYADQGTLFLDEISDLSPSLQAKLLRVLEDGRIRRVGDYKEIEVDVRIVAATNKDLADQIGKGQFREDLYYRLAVIPIRVPPLRERKEDIRLLIDHFISRFDDGRRPRIRIGKEAMDALVLYEWPGNVRELRNLMERLSILNAGQTIAPEDLPAEFRAPETAAALPVDLPDYHAAKRKVMEDFHRDIVAAALKKHGGNVSSASESIGLDRGNFQRIMRRYGLRSAEYRTGA